MKIETSQVTKLQITEVDGLDPITVILEDIGPRQGKINIDCWDQAWTAYWGGMGDRSIAEFFCSCDEHYLAKNLSNIRSSVTDYEGIKEAAKKQIQEEIKELLEYRLAWGCSKDEAREKYDRLQEAIDDLPDIHDEIELHNQSDWMHETFGEEWWHVLPEKANDDYVYLCRIINAVKDGLKHQAACKAA